MTQYLLIDCGYTSRLLENYNEMEPKPIFIWDILWGNLLNRFEGCTDEDIKNIEKHFENVHDYNYGTICFKGNNINIIDTVKMLISFDHCGFFMIDEPYSEEDEECPREIVDSDLKNFIKGRKEKKFYCGTLYDVEFIKDNNFSIYKLNFDTESG